MMDLCVSNNIEKDTIFSAGMLDKTDILDRVSILFTNVFCATDHLEKENGRSQMTKLTCELFLVFLVKERIMTSVAFGCESQARKE